MTLLAAATPLLAQDSGCGCVIRDREPNEFQKRSAGSFTITQSRPTGALGDNIGFGYGFNGAYLFRLDDAGWFSLRADAGFLQYGEESKRVPLSSTIGGRVQVRVSTNNNIVPLSLGAQVAVPRGAIRPYANAGVGAQFFFTESHVDGVDDNHDFASTTNQWDKTTSWVAGGGVYIPVYQKRTKVMLDIGAQYVNGGRARYLKPGSIQDLPDNQIRVTPMETDTHMVLVRVGVKLSL
jgi:hypothetical protein